MGGALERRWGRCPSRRAIAAVELELAGCRPRTAPRQKMHDAAKRSRRGNVYGRREIWQNPILYTVEDNPGCSNSASRDACPQPGDCGHRGGAAEGPVHSPSPSRSQPHGCRPREASPKKQIRIKTNSEINTVQDRGYTLAAPHARDTCPRRPSSRCPRRSAR